MAHQNGISDTESEQEAAAYAQCVADSFISFVEQLSKLKKDLNCPKCHHLLFNPVRLKCTHFVCRYCIRGGYKRLTCSVCHAKTPRCRSRFAKELLPVIKRIKYAYCKCQLATVAFHLGDYLHPDLMEFMSTATALGLTAETKPSYSEEAGPSNGNGAVMQYFHGGNDDDGSSLYERSTITLSPYDPNRLRALSDFDSGEEEELTSTDDNA